MSTPHPTSTTAATEAASIADTLRAEADAILAVAERVAGPDGKDWQAAVDLLSRCEGHVVVSGMGKSGLIGAKISATFSSLGQPSSVLHPAEAVHGDLGRVRRGDVVMLLSFSGQTEEVVNLAAVLRSDDVPRLGISASADSSLSDLCDVHLATGDVSEACPLNLAPTASTTAMLAMGDALALAVSARRAFSTDDFQRRHPGGMLGVGLRRITEAMRGRVGHNLVAAPDHLTVREALVESEKGAPGGTRRPGAIVLVDEAGRLSGIFTDADLRRHHLMDANVLDRPIADVMTRRPQHLVVDDLVRDAVRVVREHQFDEIPVVDHDGRPVGLVDVQDLISMKVVSE